MKPARIYIAILLAALVGVGASKAPSIEQLMDDAFSTGMKIGWAASGLGATDQDIHFLIECRRKNDPKAMERWFEEHRAKRLAQ